MPNQILVRQLTSAFYRSQYPNTVLPLPDTAISMSLSLSTPGRLGFFVDYSERTSVGTHTFYVARNQGSQSTAVGSASA